MSRFSQRVYVLLLVSSLISAAGMITSLWATPAQSAPSCHGHSRPASNTRPLSYQCCVVGHSPALQPDVPHSIVLLHVEFDVADNLSRSIPAQTVTVVDQATTSPPIITPLRI